VPLGVFVERLKADLGIDMVRVPFRGGGEAVSGLLSGATPVGLLGIANMRSQVEAGLLIGLLVDGDQRSPQFPNVPSIPEATGKSFTTRAYFGLLAPRGTPKPIVTRLQQEVARIVAQPDFRTRHLVERGLEPVASTPEAFARFIAEDRVLAQQIVKEAGIEPQ
jgi:tripartite-type tricarboxylate transporter receptor subunit TctC